MPVRLAAVLALLLAACAREPRVAPPPMLETAAPTPFACPVTSPVAAETIPEAAAAPILDGSSAPRDWLRARLPMYGNEAIWVVIPPNGTVTRDGGKSPTVRLILGELTAEAQRLDGPSPDAHVNIPGGYEEVGFQAFSVDFPVAGCWEVVQRLAGHELRFVIDVR